MLHIAGIIFLLPDGSDTGIEYVQLRPGICLYGLNSPIISTSKEPQPGSIAVWTASRR